MKSIILGNHEFTEVRYTFGSDPEILTGVMIHYLPDANHDGDAIVGPGEALPEDERDVENLLEAITDGGTYWRLDENGIYHLMEEE